MGVTGGLDCHPLPQRLLLISCPAAQPRGRGGRRDDSCLQRLLPSPPVHSLQPRAAREGGMKGLPNESPFSCCALRGRAGRAHCSVTRGRLLSLSGRLLHFDLCLCRSPAVALILSGTGGQGRQGQAGVGRRHSWRGDGGCPQLPRKDSPAAAAARGAAWLLPTGLTQVTLTQELR